MSIRLASDGHSFSVVGAEALAGAPAGEAVATEVEVLSPRTVLVPAALCDHGAGPALLAAAGLPPCAGDEVVYSDPTPGDDPAVAVMALPAAALRALGERLGPETAALRNGASGARPAALRFTSPLLHEVPEAGRCVWLCPVEGLLYIKVYDGGLRLAETIAAPAVDDALCLLDRLAEVWPLREFTLRLAGAEGAEWRKTLKRRFKRIVCES